jgi:hypothetical protein
LSVAACDNTIEPLVDGSEGAVFLYGFLDSSADSQFVRLDGARTSAFGAGPDLSTVQVTSMDDAGTGIDWAYQGTELEDGTTGHTFLGLFRPVQSGRYVLTARSVDGDITTATVTVPSHPAIRPDLPRGDTLQLVQKIRFPGLTRDPLRVLVRYEVQAPESDEPVSIAIDYGSNGTLGPAGWDFDVFLRRDHPTVMFQIDRDIGDRDVALVSIGLRAELLSPEWDDPEQAPNITGGRGFFGAVGRYDVGWTLDPDAVRNIGFVDGQ